MNTVHFTDQSAGSPTAWKWDFNNDGVIDSTSKNTSFTYTNPGVYTVKLIVSKTGSADIIVKTSYITVDKVITTTADNIPGEEWIVYPNPSRGPMVVELSNNMQNSEISIEIYDNHGKVISFIKPKNQRTITLDLTGFNGGLYMLKMIRGNEVFIKKILIK